MNTDTQATPDTPDTITADAEQSHEQREAALAAGYDDDAPTATMPPGDDDSPADTPAEAEPQPAEKPQYAQLTRQEVDDLKARAALIDQIKAAQDKGFGTVGGTIRELRQQLDTIRSAKRIEIEQSEIDELRRDGFEAHAKALEKLRDLQIVSAGVQPDAVRKIVEDRLNDYRQRMESRLLKQAHPDWETYKDDPAFAAWVTAQPEQYRAQLAEASERWDSDFIAIAMTKAKEAAKAKAAASTTRQPQPRRDAVLEAAIQPRGTGRASAHQTTSTAFEDGFAQG